MGGLSRRKLLGVWLGATATLAGCTSGPSTDGTPTAPAPSSLAIETLRFCAEQPTGYREYVEQEADTYNPGDTVWMYLEPSTVGTESVGEGQVRFRFDATWTVYTPDGEELDTLTDTVERTVPETSDLDEVFITLSVSPPMPFDAGSHSVEVELEDVIAGNRATRTAEFRVERPFSIGRLRFLADPPAGYRDYTEQPDAEYRAADTIWLYVEPEATQLEERADGDRWYELDTTVRTVGPDGSESLQVRETLSNPIPADRDPEQLFLVFNFELRQATPGEYTVEIVVQDRIGDTRAVDTATFTLVNPDRRLLDTFEQVIEDDTESELAVDHLAVSDGVCHLVYDSESTYGDSDFYWEVGYIAGAYAGLIDEGFSAETLRASGTDATGQEFAFRVESDWARANLEGELSDEEYQERVLDSLHRRG